MEDKLHRKYVDVIERHCADGKTIPLTIIWGDNDDQRYDIDSVVFSRPAAAIEVGGAGILYQVMIGGHVKRLFYDEFASRYFVEALSKPSAPDCRLGLYNCF